jgi:hypothetical protein
MDAVWSDVTAFAVAVKVAIVEPAGIVAEAGTLAAALLLASATVAPAAGAAFVSVTVQFALPPLKIEAGVQFREAT